MKLAIGVSRTGRRLFSALLLAALSPLASAELLARDAYVRLMPAVARTSAAFMVLANPGPAPLAVVAVESSVAERVELHDHLRDGEVMRMRRVERIEVPPGGQRALEPGGLHVMLIGLHAPLVDGQSVNLQLVLADGGRVAVSAPVRAPQAAPMGHAGAHRP